jgi:hypothetical protein
MATTLLPDIRARIYAFCGLPGFVRLTSSDRARIVRVPRVGGQVAAAGSLFDPGSTGYEGIEAR